MAELTPSDRHRPLDVEALRKDFPLLAREVHGHPIIYLDSAASSQQPRRARRHDATTTRRRHANVHRGVYATAEEATGAYEAARVATLAASSARPIPPARSCSPRTPPRPSTWSPTPGAAPTCGPGDAIAAHRDGAPRQHRPLAHARRGAGHRAPLAPDRRRRPPRPRRPRHAPRRRQAASASTCMSNVLGTLNPVRRARRGRPRAPARSWSPTARSSVPHLPDRRRRARRRLPRLLGAQDARAHRASACCGAARELLDAMPPFLGGGGMILDVRMDGFTPATTSRARFEAGHPADRRGRRPRRRRRLPERPRAWTPSGPTSARSPRYALDAPRRDASADAIRIFGPPTTDDRGGVICLRLRGRPRPRRRPGARPVRRLRAGRATTAPSPSCAASASTPRPGRRSVPVQRRARRGRC